jgi:protein subunit release factor B
MIPFAVSEEKNRWLRNKMDELGVRDSDIEEKFIRSSGKGGQHVNKTSTCVYLKHTPTGIEVKCMKDRSQSVNRFLARRELLEKIEGQAGGTTAGDLLRDKIRKKKSRSRRRVHRKNET